MRLRLKVRHYDLDILGERSREIHRGELAHQALYFLDPLPADITPPLLRKKVFQAIERALALTDPWAREEKGLREELGRILIKALSLAQARKFFTVGLKAYAEVEVLDEQGAVHRIDRLVYAPEGPVVLEFKLGARRRAHWEQVRLYRSLVAQVLGQPPRAYLFYLEEPALIEVSKPSQMPLF